MAVVTVSTQTVKPDRFENYLEVSRQSKAILEKCGATNMRLLAAMVAGEATGAMVFSFEAENWAASGAVTDRFFADPDGIALASAINTTAGPTVGFQVTMWVDVPL